MLLDEGFIRRADGGWRVTRDLKGLAVPGSIQALLAARLDLLTPHEQAAAGPAAVIGHVFAEDALAQLVAEPLRRALTGHLAELIRQRLVQFLPEHSTGRWYRFQHIMIRGYGVPNGSPSGLAQRSHERFRSGAKE